MIHVDFLFKSSRCGEKHQTSEEKFMLQQHDSVRKQQNSKLNTFSEKFSCIKTRCAVLPKNTLNYYEANAFVLKVK